MLGDGAATPARPSISAAPPCPGNPSRSANGSTWRAAGAAPAAAGARPSGSGNREISGMAAGVPLRACGATAGARPDIRSAKGSSGSSAGAGAAPTGSLHAAPGEASTSTRNSNPPTCSRSPLARADSLPDPKETPFTCSGLLPRSMMKNCPWRASTWACTRETVRSGSSSTSVLVPARPMVPPAALKTADIGLSTAPPRMLTTTILMSDKPQNNTSQTSVEQSATPHHAYAGTPKNRASEPGSAPGQ